MSKIPLTIILLVSLLFGKLYELPIAGKTFVLFYTDIAILGALAITAIRGRWVVPVSTSLMLWLSFILWASLSIFWAADPLRAAMNAAYLFRAILTLLLSFNDLRWQLDSWRSLTWTLRLFSGILCLQIITSFIQGANELNWQLSFYGLKPFIVTPLGGSNYLAIFLEFAIVYELIVKPRLWFILFFLYCFSLVITLSRGAFAALVIGILFVFLFLLVKGGPNRIKSILNMIFLMFTVVFIISRTTIGNIIFQSFKIVGHTEEVRLNLWGAGLEVWSKTPIIGVGFGNYINYVGMRDAHNTIIEVLVETGLIGIILFLLFFLSLFYYIINLIKKTTQEEQKRLLRAILIGLITTTVHSFVEPFFLSGSSLTWLSIIMSYVYVVSTTCNRKPNQKGIP
ncbi:O-Antigen ligase [Neomoorella glycerini]|uniref:O-Antigen ligase n=1 Tax=Neomoorella glycerini TaxID=55779 RepID=A0A6I5ZTH3_9FIRM|nr:O-antigen ligase family protein [Moorella glycerini]QGP92681.1 O-Antigen ligase [Moorella glycerini]